MIIRWATLKYQLIPQWKRGADPCKFIHSEAVRTLSPDGDLPSRHLCLTCLLWLLSLPFEQHQHHLGAFEMQSLVGEG